MPPGSAPRLNKADLEALKAACPIEAVASALGFTVDHHRFRCFNTAGHAHGDRTPSVTLWPERGSFKCWVCPEIKGDVIDLVRQARGISFGEALQWLGDFSGMPGSMSSFNPYPKPSLKPVATQPSASSKEDSTSHSNLHSRHFHTMPAHSQAHEPELNFEFEQTTPIPSLPSAVDNDLTVAPAAKMKMSESRKSEILLALLNASSAITGKAAKYLQGRRIFKKTWIKQGLKYIEDYAGVSRSLTKQFSLEELVDAGLFNAEGHLRYYRHPLLFPYFDDQGKVVSLQGRALLETIKPKELTLVGGISLPYNVAALKNDIRHVFLCEGVIDTLTLIEAGFIAVGVPGAGNFKAAWAPLFHDKSVRVVFDPDAAGEAGAHRAVAIFESAGIEASRFNLPGGKDINEWLRTGGLAF